MRSPRQPQDPTGGNYVILPSTWTDWAAWDGVLNLDTACASAPAVPSPCVCFAPPVNQGWVQTSGVYHINTQLADGRPSVLVDPGSRGNLGGSGPIRKAALAASEHGRHPISVKRDRPLNVMGVGNGSQACAYDCTTPIVLKSIEGGYVEGTYSAPVVNDSELPLLLGLLTLINKRAIMDFSTLQLHFVGPGGCKLDLSPGSNSFQMEQSPSGHLVVPIGDFAGADAVSKTARLDQTKEQVTLIEAGLDASASSSSAGPE